MKSIDVETVDNFTLKAHLFEPKQTNQKLLLVNTATGVRQQVYFPFAKYMCDHGFTVITYDYRGIGLSKPKSLKGFDASMRIWGSKDYKAMTDYIEEHYNHLTKFCLGHSVGALILGMNEGSKIFEKFVFIATQNTYVSNLNFKARSLVYLGFGLIQPVTSRLFGYFPSNLLGLGESVPKGSGEDWRTLLLNRKSLNKLLETTDDYSKDLTQDALFLKLEDDWMITYKGMNSLINDVYKNMSFQLREIEVKESDGSKIGHIDFFRSRHKVLWEIILNYVK